MFSQSFVLITLLTLTQILATETLTRTRIDRQSQLSNAERLKREIAAEEEVRC